MKNYLKFGEIMRIIKIYLLFFSCHWQNIHTKIRKPHSRYKQIKNCIKPQKKMTKKI